MYAVQAPARGGSVSTYDSNGRLVAVTDASGQVTRFGNGVQSATAAPKPASPLAVVGLLPVTINVPVDQPTIQAAIDVAVDGDTVLVADGTYTENIDFKGKAITVTSVNGSATTTINGGGASSVVSFKTAETSAAVLNGFTITHGASIVTGVNGGDGGGIFIKGASPTITNSVITNNQACEGAGIFISGGSPVIQGNTISNNTGSGCSGGIGGGGIGVVGTSSPQIVGNVITGNNMTISGINGGGISLDGAGSPLIQNNVITSNTQIGIALVSSAPQVVQNLIAHNTGGGLVTSTTGTGIVFVNNTFADNSELQSLIVPSGQASAIAGDLPADAVVQNNLLVATQGQVAVFCTMVLPANFIANDVFSNGALAFDAGCGTPPTGTSGNISADPLFVDPTVDNFHLQTLSPAIDAGNNATPIVLPATDLDGNPRSVNITVDIGALEFAQTTSTFSATSINFGQQLVGAATNPQPVTITNTGAAPLEILPFAATGDFSETDNCHTATGVAAGGSCTVNITFTPSVRGIRTGNVTVASNDAGSPTTISLTGTGIAPVVVLSVPSLTFASQTVGTTSAAQSFTVSNTGDAPLSIASIVTTGDFAQTNDCGASLGAGLTCTVNVTFAPTARGALTGAVTLTDDATTSPQSVALQGTGVGPAVTLSATSLTFAAQVAGSTSAAQPVTITNSGDSALNIASIAASGDFGQTNDCGASVAVGVTCTIQVTFSPTARGTLTGAITITDDSVTSPEQVSLSGTGTAAAVLLSDSTFSFGNQTINTPVTTTMLMTNTGDGDLIIASIATTGDFSQTNDCGTSLAVQAQCIITVTFLPSATGPLTGSVIVTDNALDSPQSVALSGTGVEIGLSAATLAFGNQQVGGSSLSKAVTLSNQGSTAVGITGIAVSAGFVQANNCPASLPFAGSCTVSVSFTPATAGPANGTVTVSYSGVQSTIALSGNGTDFSLGTQPSGSASATVAAGGTATFDLSAVGTAGYTGTVAFNCSGAPTAATCTVTPASANLNGTTPANFTVTVTTTARGSGMPFWLKMPLRPSPLGLIVFSWAGLLAFLIARLKLGKLRRGTVLATAFLGVTLLMVGCGGGSVSNTPPPPPVQTGTPAGTSTLIVTGNSNTAARTFSLTLTVK